MKNIAIVSKQSVNTVVGYAGETPASPTVKFSLKQSRFREENLNEKILEIDTDLLSLLRAIGLTVMSMLLTILSIKVTNQV